MGNPGPVEEGGRRFIVPRDPKSLLAAEGSQIPSQLPKDPNSLLAEGSRFPSQLPKDPKSRLAEGKSQA